MTSTQHGKLYWRKFGNVCATGSGVNCAEEGRLARSRAALKLASHPAVKEFFRGRFMEFACVSTRPTLKVQLRLGDKPNPRGSRCNCRCWSVRAFKKLVGTTSLRLSSG